MRTWTSVVTGEMLGQRVNVSIKETLFYKTYTPIYMCNFLVYSIPN